LEAPSFAAVAANVIVVRLAASPWKEAVLREEGPLHHLNPLFEVEPCMREDCQPCKKAGKSGSEIDSFTVGCLGSDIFAEYPSW
jgi:hypothetical protein